MLLSEGVLTPLHSDLCRLVANGALIKLPDWCTQQPAVLAGSHSNTVGIGPGSNNISICFFFFFSKKTIQI